MHTHLFTRPARFTAIAGFALIGLCTLPSQAQIVIVSNLAQPPEDVDGNTVNAAAQEFMTDGVARQLNSVTLALIGNPRDSLTVSLNSDAGGLPGASLLNLGTAIPTSNASYNNITLTPGAVFVLAANTNYWVVGRYNGVPDWAYTSNKNSVGVGAQGNFAVSQTNGASWLGPYPDPLPYLMEVQAVATATPEPGSLALLTGLGISCGFLALHRRMRRRSA